MPELCVGLFGTCDNVPWRDPFMKTYEEKGIAYFNPMVDNWHPGLVAQEARHFQDDPIVLFPILSKSYGQGSLSELGFGVLRALRTSLYAPRTLIALVDETLDDSLTDEPRRKDSLRSRQLVKAHLRALTKESMGGVYLVETLDEMLALSLHCAEMHRRCREARGAFEAEVEFLLETHERSA